MEHRGLQIQGGEADVPSSILRYVKVLRESNDISERGSAAMALGTIGNESSLSVLLEALSSPKTSQGQVIRALAALGDLRAIPPLLDLLTEQPCSSATRAAEALDQLISTRLRDIGTVELERLCAINTVKGWAVDDDYTGCTYDVNIDSMKRLSNAELVRRMTGQ